MTPPPRTANPETHIDGPRMRNRFVTPFTRSRSPDHGGPGIGGRGWRICPSTSPLHGPPSIHFGRDPSAPERLTGPIDSAPLGSIPDENIGSAKPPGVRDAGHR